MGQGRRSRLGAVYLSAASQQFGALCVVLLLAGCGGGSIGEPSTEPPAAGQPRRVTADWLRQQPGERLDGFSFHLLDAQAQPQRDWHGVSVSEQGGAGDAAREFAVSLAADGPAELFLYVVYDAAQWAAEPVALSAQHARQSDYLLLAVPRRIPDVLVIGAVRTGADHVAATMPGELLRLRFVPGMDSAFRGVSAVNEDPASAPLLELEPPAIPGANATLFWEERSIGDYNNNGLVEIADISPIGRLFRQTTATAADPLEFVVVDGDGNGEINAADLLPIARNYQRGIEGFQVFSAPGTAPDAASYGELGDARLERAVVFGSTPPSQQRHRLRYSYHFSPALGPHSYIVRAYNAAAGGGVEYGLPSNSVALDGQPGNLPPDWETTAGLTQVEGVTGGLRLHFGRALDPEGGPVDYLLRYMPGTGQLSGPGVIEQLLPAAASAGEPPYSYDLPGLASGTTYTLLLLAQDEIGLRTSNTQLMPGAVPGFAAPSGEWTHWRGNPARTGSNPASAIREPLVLQWSHGIQGWPASPLVSDEAWAALQVEGAVTRFSLDDGEQLGAEIKLGGNRTWSLPALSGRYFVSNEWGGCAVADLLGGGAKLLPAPTGQPLAGSPLLFGDYLFGVEAGGSSFCQLIHSGASEWVNPGGSSASTAPCSDGVSLFTLLDSGALAKTSLLDGAVTATAQLGAAGEYGSMLCNVEDGLLYCAGYAAGVEARQLNDLSLAWEIPPAADESAGGGLLLAAQFAQPLLLRAKQLGSTQYSGARLSAYDPLSGTAVWSADFDSCTPLALSAAAARVFFTVSSMGGGELLVLDPANGSVLQRLEGGLPRTEAVPAGDRLLLVRIGTGAHEFQALSEAPALPVVWTGTTGISALEVEGTDSIHAYWDAATAPDGLVVRYALYYAELPSPGPGIAPMFDPPHTGTVVIPGLSAADGAGGYLVSGLTPGRRYTFAVRAYYGRWGENAVDDGNTSWLAATAAWSPQPSLDMGAAPPPGGFELPPGEAYLLKGVLDDAGRVQLVYNDEATTELTYVWQDAGGGWQAAAVEVGGTASIATDFELQWVDGALHIAYADSVLGDRKTGILSRSGPGGIWEETAFASQTFDNPQVSFALGTPPLENGPGALVYTQFISGAFPTPIGAYYIIRTDEFHNWLSAAPLDIDNNSGRDISVALDPVTLLPWAAYQRGYHYASNRLTPRNGELFFARDDGAGGYQLDLVDAGANPRLDADDAFSSDVGKRVQMLLDGGGLPRLAYLDLNASRDVPLGQLRYAAFDGADWQIEVVNSIDLSFQSFASLQYTYGELSFALTPAGSPGGADRPLIGMLARTTATHIVHQPHLAYPVVFVQQDDGAWQAEQLGEAIEVYPNDREPCVLLAAPDRWLYFTATRRDAVQNGARRIAWWQRGL